MAKLANILKYAKFVVAVAGVAVLAASEALSAGGSYQTIAIAAATAVGVYLVKNRP